MKKGKLHLKEDLEWVLKYDQLMHTPVGNHDYKVTLQDAELLIHPTHSLWLKIFGKDGMDVSYEVETIAVGDDEWSIQDCDVAVLKADGPDTHYYTQD